MENHYRALRLWSMVLRIIGILSVLSVVLGVIIAMFQAPSFADVLTILFIVGPLGALLATWPIALGQGLEAIADVAEYAQAQQTRR